MGKYRGFEVRPLIGFPQSIPSPLRALAYLDDACPEFIPASRNFSRREYFGPTRGLPAECNPRRADRHKGGSMSRFGPVIDPKEMLARPTRRDFIKLAGVGGAVLVSGFALRSY